MSIDAEPIAVTLRVAAELDRLGVEYLVGGSLASSVHGLPRTTQDVDLVARIAGRHVHDLVSALEQEFYIDADMRLALTDLLDRAVAEARVPPPGQGSES